MLFNHARVGVSEVLCDHSSGAPFMTAGEGCVGVPGAVEVDSRCNLRDRMGGHRERLMRRFPGPAASVADQNIAASPAGAQWLK